MPLYPIRGFSDGVSDGYEKGAYVFALIEAPDATTAIATAAALRFDGKPLDCGYAGLDAATLGSIVTPLGASGTGALFGFFSDGAGGTVEPDPIAGASRSTRYYEVPVTLSLGREYDEDADGTRVLQAPGSTFGDTDERELTVVVEADSPAAALALAEPAAHALYDTGMEYPYGGTREILEIELPDAPLSLDAGPSGLVLAVLDVQGLGGPALG